MAALRNKRIGDKHRHEIVQEICSRMINFCKYPTSMQRGIVAAKLVQKFPQLRDSSFTCGHVRKQHDSYLLTSIIFAIVFQNSWVTLFQRRMANLRRPGPDDNRDTKPPEKRQRVQKTGRNHVLPTKLDDLTYQRHVRSMKVLNLHDARSRSTVSHLMVLTIPNRMEWIKETKSSTKHVLEEFPHLRDNTIVS